MKKPALYAALVAAAVWCVLSYQTPAPEGVSAFAVGGWGKILAALLPAVIAFVGSMPNTPKWLRVVLSFFTDQKPEPAPGPTPGPLPVPAPGPVNVRDELLRLAILLLTRNAPKDEERSDSLLAMYREVLAEEGTP